MRRILRSPVFEEISEGAFYIPMPLFRRCPRNKYGKKNIGTLRPDVIQDHRFYIDFDENDSITKLVVAKSGEQYSYFSLYVNNDGTYWADYCHQS